MEAATATLVGEPQQLPTAPEMPTTSTSGSIASDSQSDRGDSTNDNIGWVRDKPESTSELRQRATSYSFTGSALAGDNFADLNGAAGAASAASSSTANAASNDNNNSSSSTNSNTSNDNDKDKEQSEESLYECNICLDTAKDAVVSMCGHLFCWPCLHQWLQTRPNRKLCPVCKAAVDKDKVIPLYGRNSTRQEDPRNKVPPRPAGQRTEPEPQQGFPGFGFGDGFHMSFGIGAFPFGFFTSTLNLGEPRPAPAHRGTTQYEDEQTLSRLFLYLAFVCIGWLLFA